MPKRSSLTEIEIQAIKEAYENGQKTSDIAAQFGISHTSVTRYASKMGAILRKPRKITAPATRKCPNCHRAIGVVPGMKYCYFCAVDIRTDKELLLERIDGFMHDILFLPDNKRDNAHKLMLDIRAELQKEVK